MCMSHQLTSSLITTLGKGHDSRVLEWRERLLNDMESEVFQYYMQVTVTITLYRHHPFKFHNVILLLEVSV